MMSAAGGGAPEAAGGGGAGGGQAAAPGGGETERGERVQQISDRYEGEFLNGLKHGRGKVTWTNGEFHEGSYYKDYRHGLGLYSWPSGHRFTGRFYLNRKEGYGHQLFPDGASFQGLYHMDQRFGPGVVTYSDGRQDVGLWVGPRLLRLCSPLQEGFCLRNHPEYPAYVDLAAVTDSLTQPPVASAFQSPAESDLLPEDNFIYPPGLETYSTNGDFLPLPPGRRRELDQIFYGELWEPDMNPYQGYKHDPFSSLPLQARMQANIHRHRPLAERVSWDVAAVLSLTRKGFGPKGPLEVASEQLIQSASQGDLRTVSQLLMEGLVYADVADSRGNTALMAAAINNHHEVIRLLLDHGVDIDKLNSDGMSALAVCHVLYFPLHSLNTAAVEFPQVLMNPSACGSSGQIGRVAVDTLRLHRGARGLETTVEVKEETEEGAEGRHVQKEDKEVWEWRECGAEPEEDAQDEDLPREQTSVSACAVGSFTLRDTQKAKRKAAPMPHERHVHLDTLDLLLEHGSDPNKCKVPMPVLFLAIMAADSEVVSRLLLSGARTDVTLPPEWKGLYPLHVAAALPGPAGLRITELLLCAVTDPDAQACDQDDIYGPDKGTLIADEWRGGGRTALHVACQRNTSEVVSLLLSHKASTHLLWSGHSPLSLAIASGNDQVVEQLLRGGADPNINLGHGVGSALCAAVNINYHLCVNRTQLLHMLVEAGADILMPVMVGDAVGTAVDFAHDSFNQDMRIAHTPFHALNLRERETLIARRQLLSMMGDLLRRTAAWMEEESLEREEQLTPNEPVYPDGSVLSSEAPPKENLSKQILKFCDHCGRSVSVKLAACSRCHKVSYCSMVCKLKAWEERHKDECFRAAVSGVGSKKKAVLKSPKGPGPLSDRMRPPLVTESILESQVRPKENYSCN